MSMHNVLGDRRGSSRVRLSNCQAVGGVSDGIDRELEPPLLHMCHNMDTRVVRWC
jgi:LSD1 subclass zinc finger protein